MPIEGPVAIILAAGHGKRMKSELPKVLHPVCGRPLVSYVIEAARGAGARTILVVVGHGGEAVRMALGDEPDVRFAVQERQLGTGDAVRACRPGLEGYRGPALVLVGDEPLLRPEPLATLLDRQRVEAAGCLLGTAILPDPTGFGRIIRDAEGRFRAIVEQKDATPDERAVREVNPSCYVFDLPDLWDALDRLDTGNAQGEYYLTDAPRILMEMGRTVLAEPALDALDVLGINTRAHLAEAHALMQARIQSGWMAEGVTIVDPRNTSIDGRARIGPDSVIFPFSVIGGPVTIGRGCRVGPFAHVRAGTILGDGVEVGAFVEVNRSTLAEGTTARHLAYLGDANLGPGVNVGAGTITANFDGRVKSPTEVGAGAFLGAGSILIAPTKIGEDAIVGAGAVLTKGTEVPPGSTVIGVPARPLNPRPAKD